MSHNAQSVVAFSLSAAGLLFGGWLLIKCARETVAALTLPNPKGCLR